MRGCKTANDFLTIKVLTCVISARQIEPGGYLQWVDADILSSAAISPSPSLPTGVALEDLISLMRKPQAGANYEYELQTSTCKSGH